MAQYEIINRLFSTALNDDMRRFHISNVDIRTAIQNMSKVYLPNPTSLSSQFLDVANYNDAAHRCAYLHKYAPFHTALVYDTLLGALGQQQFRNIFHSLLSNAGRMNICSLGGGPGNDVFGVILVLLEEFGFFFQLSATIVDYMEQWRETFNLLIEELRRGYYGDLGEIVQPQYFAWEYIGSNLLGRMSNEVNRAIQAAHLVTMVKFVSAAACQDTPVMLRKIFKSLKTGSLILYIDNAGGGFHQLIRKCADECNMITVYGPLKHQVYSNANFNIQRFGYTSCYETKVSSHIWRKPHANEPLVDLHYLNVDSTTHQNTYNQYNINNTNICNANFLSTQRNNPHVSGNKNKSAQRKSSQRYGQGLSPERQPYRSNVQRQPREQDSGFSYQIMNDEDNDEEQNCSCCVIS